MFWRIAILFVILISPGQSFAQEVVRVRNGDHQTFSRLVFDWQETVAYTATLTGDRLEISFDKASAPNWGRLQNEPMQYLRNPAYRIEDGKLIVTLKVSKSGQLKHFRTGTRIVFDIIGIDQAAEDASAQTLDPRPVVKAEQIEQDIYQGQGDIISDTGPLKLTVTRRRDNLRLSYPWRDDVRVAAFIRHNYLWVVFEDKRTVDHSDLDPFLGQRVISARQMDHPSMTVLMYEVMPGQNIKAQRYARGWQIDLKTSRTAPARHIMTSHKRAGGSGGENFFYSVGNAGSVLFLDDPIIGDQLAIIPVMEPSQGVLQTQKFVEFESLATAQGIGIQLIADNLNVVKYTNGVSVAAQGGLAVSRSQLSSQFSLAAEPGQETDGYEGQSRNLVDFAAWKHGPLAGGGLEEDYYASKHELLYMLSNSTDGNRSEIRWRLARFYLANGRRREAFGVLNVMLDDESRLMESAEFRVVLGVTNILMRRFAEGAKLLDHKALLAESEVYLWRAVAESALDKHELALENYKKGSDVLSLNDPDSQIRFILAAIRSAYEVGDYDFIGINLSFLGNLPLNAAQLTEMDYWRALLERHEGDELKSEERLQGLIKAGVRQTAAWAKYDMINLDLDSKKIDATEAIDQLEKLRFAWRGDEFELKLLSRLGDIYVEQNEFNTGLQTLKLAVTFFERSKKTTELTRQMNQIYRDLFLKGKADNLSPVKAVALYSEFQELIPLGKDGDTMTRRLADRLVLLDLLEEAAELLNHQIKFRLKGAAQSVVASRLAMIYLLDSKADEALGILRATRSSQIPDDVHDRRQMIEARTLIELDRFEEAEVLIEEYKTAEAEDMRLDIYWRSENWPKYINHKNRLLGDRYQDDAALSPTERLAVLRLSVAYVINGDAAGVKILRDRYKAHMDNGLYGDTFEVITAERQLTDMNVGRLTRSIASVSKLETFMESYRAEFSDDVVQN